MFQRWIKGLVVVLLPAVIIGCQSSPPTKSDDASAQQRETGEEINPSYSDDVDDQVGYDEPSSSDGWREGSGMPEEDLEDTGDSMSDDGALDANDSP